MVKKNNLKLVSPTVKEIEKKAGRGGGVGASTTTLFSIVVSMAIIASISVIGITLGYMLSYSTEVEGKCIKDVLAFEQKGYYANLEEYKAASASCIK
jgi:hypothetical protein